MTPRRELERSLAQLDRRGFLRLTGAVAAAGLLPAGCSAPDRFAPPPDLDLRVLSPRTYATLSAASDRLLGAEARARVEAAGFDLAARADARLAETPALTGLVQQALLALEFGVWPLVPKLRPFSRLDAPTRDAVLGSLARGPLDLSRALFQGVRSFTWLAYYGDTVSHAAIRYPGPFGGPGARVEDAMTYDPDTATGEPS